MIIGTAHSSAVTNLDLFEKMIENVANDVPGTAHSSAVTNPDAFAQVLESVKNEVPDTAHNSAIINIDKRHWGILEKSKM